MHEFVLIYLHLPCGVLGAMLHAALIYIRVWIYMGSFFFGGGGGLMVVGANDRWARMCCRQPFL